MQLAQRAHAYFLFGTVAETREGAPLNSAVLLRPDGTLVDRYDKINLVPFGEYVPPVLRLRESHHAGDQRFRSRKSHRGFSHGFYNCRAPAGRIHLL
jgi:apolipoprotein N-acyltransferase